MLVSRKFCVIIIRKELPMKQLVSLFLVLLFIGCHNKGNGQSSANILPDAKGDRQQFSFDMLEVKFQSGKY